MQLTVAECSFALEVTPVFDTPAVTDPPISFLGCAYFGLFKRQTYYTSYTHLPVSQSPFFFPLRESWKVSEYCRKVWVTAIPPFSLAVLSCKETLQGKVNLLASTQRMSKWRGLDASYQQDISPEVFKTSCEVMQLFYFIIIFPYS